MMACLRGKYLSVSARDSHVSDSGWRVVVSSALSKSNAMAVSRMSEWPSIIMPIGQERAVACESLDSEKEGK